MFDSTVGATTVALPFGGKYQTTETEGCVQTLPILNAENRNSFLCKLGF
jgi:phosphoribosylformylglycinamidine synthase